MKPASCRLFVIPAAAAPVAVILRRGPSAWYQVIKWNMRQDTFIDGAWLRGRIYEEKCDVSPDGALFVYSAYKRLRLGEKTYACFTAVSRPPWLRALVVWPQNTTYGGGGRFVGPRCLALEMVGGSAWPELPRSLTLSKSANVPLRTSTDEIHGAQWCGRDHRDQLIFTIGGCLFRQVGKKAVQLADFTNREPDPQPAPKWAETPLR